MSHVTRAVRVQVTVSATAGVKRNGCRRQWRARARVRVVPAQVGARPCACWLRTQHRWSLSTVQAQAPSHGHTGVRF
eukprot:3432082-Rhodomonas_salina.1